MVRDSIAHRHHVSLAVHASRDFLLCSAKAVVEIEAKTDYSKGLTFNTGTIHGGSVANTVPGKCEALVEMRCDDPQLFALEARVSHSALLRSPFIISPL